KWNRHADQRGDAGKTCTLQKAAAMCTKRHGRLVTRIAALTVCNFPVGVFAISTIFHHSLQIFVILTASDYIKLVVWPEKHRNWAKSRNPWRPGVDRSVGVVVASNIRTRAATGLFTQLRSRTA